VQVELYFSEAASLDFSSIRLYDRSRKEYPLGALARVGGADNSVAAPVPAPLPPGTYTVVWKVVSAVDGHLTAGSFAFRVRPAPGTQATPGPQQEQGPVVPVEGLGGGEGNETDLSVPGGAVPAPGSDPVRWIVRAVILACAAFVLGGSLFTVLVFEPAAGEAGPASLPLWRVAGRRFAMAALACCCLLVVALVLDLLAEVALIGGGGGGSVLADGPLALRLIESTSWGFAWALKLLAGMALVWLMLAVYLLGSRGMLWDVSVACGSLLLLGEALGSHAAANRTTLLMGLPLPVLSDWLHLVMAAAWAGGLGYMALALFPAFRTVGASSGERRAFLGRAVPRFSRLAVFSVAALAITGVYNLIVHSSDLSAIAASLYGQLLAVKVGLFVVLVAVGAVNLLRLSPMLRAGVGAGRGASEARAGDDPPAVRRLWRNVRLEVVLVVLVLVCAGGLTLLPPPGRPEQVAGAASPPVSTADQGATPQDLTPQPAPDQLTPAPTPVPAPATAQQSAGGYTLTLTAYPSIEGDRLTLTMERASPSAPPLTDVVKVYFRVTPQDVSAGSSRYDAALSGSPDPGVQVWSATGQVLTLDGTYLVTAVVQRTVQRDLKAAFRLELSGSELRASPAQVVDLRLDSLPDPPISGTVTLTITLLDGEGEPMAGAAVTVLPLMPAHAHVQPEALAAPVPGRPGVYSVPVKLQMGGSWLFVCRIERPGQPPVVMDASLDVVDPNATPTTAPASSPAPP
jgi:putative copper export protein